MATVPRRVVPGIDQQTVGATDSTEAARAQESGYAGRQAGRLAEGLQNLGGVMADAGARMNESEDAQRVLEADTAMNQHVAQAQREQESLEADAARGTSSKYAEEAAKQRNKISEGLNDRQRLAFLNRSDATMVGFTDRLARHEQKQNGVALSNATQNNIASTIQAAAGEVDNDRRMAATVKSLDTINQGAAVLAQQHGWDVKTKEQWVLANTTKLHTEIIENLTNGDDPKLAKAYFDLNKKQIAPTEWNRIEKGLKVAVAKSTGMALVDGVQGLVQNTARGDLPAAMEQVRADIREKTKDNPEAREYAERALDHRLAQREQADAKLMNEAANVGWKFFDQGGINAIPASVWTAMDGHQQAAMRNAERAEARFKRAEARADKVAREDDPDTMVALSNAITDGSLRDYDLRLVRGKIKDSTWNGMLATQTRMRLDPQNQRAESTMEQKMLASFETLGLRDKQHEQQRGQLRDSIHAAALEQLEVERKNRGAKAALTDEQQNDVINRVVLNGRIKGGSWMGMADTKLAGYQLQTEAEVKEFRLTPEAMVRYGNMLQARGAKQDDGSPYTADQINDLYRDFLRNNLRRRTAIKQQTR